MLIESYYEKGFELECEAKYLESSYFPEKTGNYYAGNIDLCNDNIILTRPWGGQYILPKQPEFMPIVETVNFYDGNGSITDRQIGVLHFSTGEFDFKIIPPNQKCLAPINLNPLQIQSILKRVGIEAVMHNELKLPHNSKPDIIHLYNFPNEQEIMNRIRQGSTSFGEIGINWEPFWLPELLAKYAKVDKNGLLQSLPPLVAYCYK